LCRVTQILNYGTEDMNCEKRFKELMNGHIKWSTENEERIGRTFIYLLTSYDLGLINFDQNFK